MSGVPLFTVVDTDTHEEIRLVDRQGRPCAVPASQAHRDEDERYNYTGGKIGRSPRTHRHSISLSCNFLPDDIRARLARLKADGAEVYFTPGFGERTVLAWRPIAADGSLEDLTGQHTLTVTGGANQAVWDHWTRKPRVIQPDSGDTAPALIVETPCGAGQSLQESVTNRWSPGYPESATPGFGTGAAGWDLGGLSAPGDITLTHVTGGFENTDCPDCLRVQVDSDVAAQRYLYARDLWDSTSGDYEGYSFAGAGIVSASVWVKGRFPAGAAVVFSRIAKSGGVETVIDTVDLDDLGDGWQKVVVNGHDADWSLYVPQVKIDLASANGERADFLVGPMAAVYYGYFGSHCRWSGSGVATTGEAVVSSSISKPQTGSATISFYVPRDCVLPSSARSMMFSIDTVNNGHLRILADSSGDTFARFYYGASSYIESAIDLTTGPHSVSVLWGTSYLAMAIDGVMAVESTAATDKDFEFLSDGAVRIGHASYSTWPLIPLTFRLDEDQHRDDAVDIQAALMDTVSLGTITAARGRKYEIQSLPSTPLIADGRTFWIGNLVLSQVAYSRDTEDITTKEV